MKYNLPIEYSKATPKQRREVREQYIFEQAGLCMWCFSPLEGDPHPQMQKMDINLKLFPPGFLKNPVHLKHNHDSDLTEGAVHAKCNGVMWQYHGR